ncbi:MAG: hypothetical protein R6X34_24170 [Chloroflexota bacterium]
MSPPPALQTGDASPSPEILTANARLHELRQRLQTERLADGSAFAAPQAATDSSSRPAPQRLKRSLQLVDPVQALPAHLGWDSQPASQAIRASLIRCASAASDLSPLSTSVTQSATASKPLSWPGNGVSASRSWRTLDDNVVKHYPGLGTAVIQRAQVPVYRIWLLCRYVDREGRGWLPVDAIRHQLTNKHSDLRLCDWRRLRQILAQGEGRFWKWDKGNGRLWLLGAACMAASLGIRHLTGKPVALPLSAITESIGAFKAHLYGAWHSGRKANKPISRKVQESLTGVPERTQRRYCKVAGICRQTNIAVGQQHSSEAAAQAAWQQGRAAFSFTDYQGRQGRKGITYIAWRLPNSYANLHQPTSKGRMRKINRKLKDLVTIGAQGNEQMKVEKLYYASGKEAARAASRGKREEAYWPVPVKARQEKVWAVFSQQGSEISCRGYRGR